MSASSAAVMSYVDLAELLTAKVPTFIHNLTVWNKASSDAQEKQQALKGLQADTPAICRPLMRAFFNDGGTLTNFAKELAKCQGMPTQENVRVWLKAFTLHWYQEEYATDTTRIYLSLAAAEVLGGWLLGEQDDEKHRGFYYAIKGAELKTYNSKTLAEAFVARLLPKHPVTQSLQDSMLDGMTAPVSRRQTRASSRAGAAGDIHHVGAHTMRKGSKQAHDAGPAVGGAGGAEIQAGSSNGDGGGEGSSAADRQWAASFGAEAASRSAVQLMRQQAELQASRVVTTSSGPCQDCMDTHLIQGTAASAAAGGSLNGASDPAICHPAAANGGMLRAASVPPQPPPRCGCNGGQPAAGARPHTQSDLFGVQHADQEEARPELHVDAAGGGAVRFDRSTLTGMPSREHEPHPLACDSDMDAAAPLDLAHAPLDIIINVLESMSLEERFTCALVCKVWAEAATAATRSIILSKRRGQKDLSCLQTWLEKHGDQLEVLQLEVLQLDVLDKCPCPALTALPCPQLQHLLLSVASGSINVSSSVWNGIAAATKLTSVSLKSIKTASQQEDIVSALTALPNLKQLTWRIISCGDGDCCRQLSDSLLLQSLTRLTALELGGVTAPALQHLGSLAKLQRLSIDGAHDWTAAGCPGLQELKALTYLGYVGDIPAGISQLTALQHLALDEASLEDVTRLQPLTGLTQLWLLDVQAHWQSLEARTLQLPGLRHLRLSCCVFLPMSILRECTQLQVLTISGVPFTGPGILVASTLLQHMALDGCSMINGCSIIIGDGDEDPGSWKPVFSGRLPHLTSLRLSRAFPEPRQTDIEDEVACCSSLQVLDLDTLHDSFASALARLSGLTGLHLGNANDQECSSLAQLTGLRELSVFNPTQVSAVGLRQLAALEQLTSLRFVRHLNTDKVGHVLHKQTSDRLLGESLAIINKASAPQ